jgi:peptidoglycan/LPS O-acetylase OafA/YrhL
MRQSLTQRLPTILTAVVLLGLLAVAVRFMVSAWNLTDAHMSGHGWFALTLGIIFSMIFGCGLMALMFYSSRRGYDEAVTRPEYWNREIP